ncbi:hypothetical protein [Aliagarivorans marinus]|uniref:hypothetical protein n=1 Tax=Aliagarivorans marinus TaxID=561965 RepID=UPI0004046AEB|nr:hypothetical protein [Aliagarivorans marinus]
MGLVNTILTTLKQAATQPSMKVFYQQQMVSSPSANQRMLSAQLLDIMQWSDAQDESLPEHRSLQ